LDGLRKIARPYDEYDELDSEFESENGGEGAAAYDGAEETPPPRAARRNPFSGMSREEEKRADAPVMKQQSQQTAPARSQRAPAASATSQVAMYSPESFRASAEVADRLKAGCAVLLSTEKAEAADERRILDFISGVAYAMEGKVKRAGHKTYLIVPRGIALVGDAARDDVDEMDSGGFYF